VEEEEEEEEEEGARKGEEDAVDVSWKCRFKRWRRILTEVCEESLLVMVDGAALRWPIQGNVQ
jgi:hypothetical protein